jgi:deoxycytidine triphosphate deaminase
MPATSVLSDGTIRRLVDEGRIRIDPWDPGRIQPASVDLLLGTSFRVFHNHRTAAIDLREPPTNLTEQVEVSADEPFVIHPGEFVLGRTLEYVELPDDVVARIEGKALALDTEVPTPNGWRSMGDLEPGDEVFDAGGRPTRILAATHPMIGRPCREVRFSDGTTVVADAAHLWETRTREERRRHSAGKVRTTDEIARTLRYGVAEYNHHVEPCAPVEYPERDLPIDPYVLGAWIGDGTSTAAVITTADQEIVQELALAGYAPRRTSAPYGWWVGGTGRSRNEQTGRFASNDSLSSELRDHHLLGAKRIPRAYLEASVAQRQSLLEGLMDTDGKRSRGITAVTPVRSVPVKCIEVESPRGLFLVTRSHIPTHNSSLGRLGLIVHATAGFVDPGFRGTLTLEITNLTRVPIKLYAERPIAQLSFMTLDRPAERPYGHPDLGSHYQGQVDATESRYGAEPVRPVR